MGKFYLFFLFVVLFCLVGCQKTETVPSEKSILSFQIAGFEQVKPVIAPNSVELTLPYSTFLKNLKPVFQLSPGTSSVPASGQEQDFTKPVLYTLTGADGSKTIYQVIVKTASQPQPQLLQLERDTLEAGQSLLVKGRYFGVFALDVKATLSDANTNAIPCETQLIDSTQIKLTVPIQTAPGRYQVKISIKQLSSATTLPLQVSYPTPQIVGVTKQNILQGDTLVLQGKFISPQYQYQLLLAQQNLSPVKTLQDQLHVIIPKRISPGVYDFVLQNKTWQKNSPSSPVKIRIYDAQQPFVSGLLNPKNTYIPAATVTFKTQNFTAFPTRFYQIDISSESRSFTQNGIYDAKTQALQCSLPANIPKGRYQISILLVSDNNQRYDIQLDDNINIQ